MVKIRKGSLCVKIKVREIPSLALLRRWYRRRLREQIPPLVAKWEPEVGVKVAEWGIKRMKTRWGTCHMEARRIWLNLELAKKTSSCLEYILVHEMVHFHLVWSPKYRKRILEGALAARVEEMFKEIGEAYDITIDEMEVSPDHVHLFCSFPPRYSIAQVVTRFKSLSARAVFREFPQVKRKLWGGEFWEDGYFAGTVGDKVTAEVIRKYIRRHKETEDPQLDLFG
jgi:putative transposase